MRVAVLSDTHGLLRDEVHDQLHDVDFILHAGDVGTPDVLERLRRVAPTLAVRGNIDRGELADLPETLLHDVGGVWVYVLHDLNDLDLSPAAAGIRVVISGHSHVPKLDERGGVVYLNPGSCGRRRFKLPVSIAFLTVRDGDVRAELVELDAILPA